jgi:hypothetical protein
MMPRMIRNGVRAAVVAFAIIGFGAVVGWLWPSSGRAVPPPDNLTFVDAPDARFTAAVATWAGGGAIAPYCIDNIFVVPKETARDAIPTDENIVFQGECGSFISRDGEATTSPDLSWRGPRALTIRFSLSRAVARPEKFRLRGQNTSGEVTIQFEARQHLR